MATSPPDFEPLRHSLSPEDGARSGPMGLKVAALHRSVAVGNGLKVDAGNHALPTLTSAASAGVDDRPSGSPAAVNHRKITAPRRKSTG